MPAHMLESIGYWRADSTADRFWGLIAPLFRISRSSSKAYWWPDSLQRWSIWKEIASLASVWCGQKCSAAVVNPLVYEIRLIYGCMRSLRWGYENYCSVMGLILWVLQKQKPSATSSHNCSNRFRQWQKGEQNKRFQQRPNTPSQWWYAIESYTTISRKLIAASEIPSGACYYWVWRPWETWSTTTQQTLGIASPLVSSLI